MRRLLPLVLALAALAAWWVVDRQAPVEPMGTTREAPAGSPGEARLEGAATRGGARALPDDEGAPFDSSEIEFGPLQILDARTGTPVVGAEFCATGFWRGPTTHEASSDPDGRVEAPRLGFTALWMVRCTGYVFHPVEVRGGHEPKAIHLDPAPPLRGRVVDAASGVGLAGVRILATWADASRSLADPEQETDAEGRFVVAGVPPDRRVDLVAALSGFATVRARSDGSDAIEVRLGCGAEIHGRVLDETGNGVPGADVSAADVGTPSPFAVAERVILGGFLACDEMWPTHATTDAHGRFLLRGIHVPSDTIVYARGPKGRVGRSLPVRLRTADDLGQTDVVAAPAGVVLVTYRDGATGTRLPAHRMCCSIDADWSHADEHQRARSRVDSDDEGAGVSFFVSLHCGSRVIHVLPPRHLAPPPIHVEVEAGVASRIEFVLEEGLTVTGRIVDDSGEPLQAYVMFDAVWRGVRQHPNARSGEDGRFTLRAVPPVAGELSAFESGLGNRAWPDVEISGHLGDLVLPRPAVLVGRLPPALRDTPIICGTTPHSNWSEVGEVDSEGGRIRIEGLVAGEPTHVFLRPEGTGTALVLRDLVLAAGEVRDLGLLAFPEPVEVTGRILDAQGRPVSGALVRVVERWYDERTRTDTAGRFRLSRFPQEPSTLWIETAPSAVAFASVAATPEMAPLEIRLEAPGRLRCRLLGPDGLPVPNSPVNIARLGADGEADWGRRTIPRTDSLGLLDLTLYPGGYAIIPHANAGLEAIGGAPRIEITPDASVEIEIRTHRPDGVR